MKRTQVHLDDGIFLVNRDVLFENRRIYRIHA